MAGPLARLTELTELNQLKRDTSRSWDRYAGHLGMARRIAGSRRLRKIGNPTSELLAGMYSGRWNHRNGAVVVQV